MRTGIIEIGHWHASGYAGSVRKLGEEIVAVSDHDPAVAKQRAAELNCRAYTSHLDLIEKERLDFVFAHGIHAQMTAIAADLVAHGVPFAMEKPMGTDWRALAAVADAAERRRLFAGVDLVMRCYRVMQALMQLRERGELGEVTSYTQRLLAGEPNRYRTWNVPWVLDPALAGGGPLFNFAPHVIDILLLLSGRQPETVYCHTSHRLHQLAIDDHATLIVTLEGGAVATLEVGYVCPDSKYDQFFGLCTTNLFFSTTRYDNGTVLFRDGREYDLAGPDAPAAVDYTRETLRRVRAGEPPLASIRDMCRALRVINAAATSAGTGGPIRL